MSIKSGELIHVGNQVLIDRAQTAGPGTLNIPTEKIYELGNYQSVATVRNTPDLSFTLESLDASAEIESMLLGLDFPTLTAGQALDLANCIPLDVASQFKAGKTATNPYDVEASVAIPFLTPESIAYRFGLTDNATQAVTLRGDSIFYSNGSTFIQEVVGSGTAGQTVVLAHNALPYNGDAVAGAKYALGVTLKKAGERLTLGTDYTEAATGAGPAKAVTITLVDPVPASETIRVIYQSSVVATYPQISHAIASATRPAALKGRDLEVRVGGTTITDRWSMVQSATAEWRVTLQRDEEFGNPNAVSQDYDVPAVTGTVEIKPRNSAELVQRVQQIAGVATADEVVGPLSSVLLPLEIILHSPTDGSVLKTLYVPDARFTLPGYSGRVQQKLTVTFNFESDGGSLIVYNGAKP